MLHGPESQVTFEFDTSEGRHFQDFETTMNFHLFQELLITVKFHRYLRGGGGGGGNIRNLTVY